MDEPFLSFEWPVFPVYHWQDWLDSRGRPVVVRPRGLMGLETRSSVEHTWQELEKMKKKTGPVMGPVFDKGPPKKYSPMQREPALFQTFAALDYNDTTAILAFASQYGHLGLPIQEQLGTPERPNHYVAGESHIAWAREIALMQEAMSLARPRSDQELGEEDARYKAYELDPERYRKENRKKLKWLFDLHLQGVQPRIAFERDAPPRLSFAPLTLLSAMWLQYALSLVEDKQFPACKFCRRLFEISTSIGFRTHREFCSDSCKTKDYRRRKRTALRLLREGRPLGEVAKQTATAVTTIRSWKATMKLPSKSIKRGT